MKKKRLILASSSVYRKILLGCIRADFECISPNIDETRKSEEKAQEMVIRLAIEKAEKISEHNKNAIIIDQNINPGAAAPQGAAGGGAVVVSIKIILFNEN